MEINKLENWTKENDWNGHFRYSIGYKCYFEIFVECWYVDTPIETAKASLCITRYCKNQATSDLLERDWIGKHLPVCELLEMAKNIIVND